MSDAIRLEGISKQLGEREILRDVSFTVKQGDIFGYLGPNGAEKTPTIRILLGLLKPNSGRAYILGEDISKDEARRKVGFVLESDGLYDNKTAEENLWYYARIYGMAEPTERKVHRDCQQMRGVAPRWPVLSALCQLPTLSLNRIRG